MLASYDGAAKEGCEKGVRAIGRDILSYESLGFRSMWRAFTWKSPIDVSVDSAPPQERLDQIPLEQRGAYTDCFTRTTIDTRRMIAAQGRFQGRFMFWGLVVAVVGGVALGLALRNSYGH